MLHFDPEIAESRFGYGYSPSVQAPVSVDQMLARLRTKDEIASRFVIKDSSQISASFKEFSDLSRRLRIARKLNPKEDVGLVVKEMKQFRSNWRKQSVQRTGSMLMRRVWTQDALRERLIAFWTDHFSAPGKTYNYRFTFPSYVETAIRPNVTKSFSDLLLAAVLHPQMLKFLDQPASVGPNSSFAKKNPAQKRGLNENLAREILELHTLGVNGHYSQNDVRELAKLLTGLWVTSSGEARFIETRSEPGQAKVLGKLYGGARDGEESIADVLNDLARHPDTARHIANKLATHFISDAPPKDLVKALEMEFLASDGDLMRVSEALLRHPAAWHESRANFKQPDLFVSSALRALAVSDQQIENVSSATINRNLLLPLRKMGQPWGEPAGPDGFEEHDSYWLTPQGMGARLQWSLAAPTAFAGELPDPREFVVNVLGSRASDAVMFAARAAENRREGVALVLMSPEFQRC